MTATNHALTGAVIGLAVGNPWIAIPVAFLSHFVLDALPHYDPAKPDLASKKFRNYLIIDASLCVLLVLLLAITQPQYWQLAAFCAFVATTPDLMWAQDFFMARRGAKERDIAHRSAIVRLHAFVQWYHKPQGAILEVLWFVAASVLLAMLVG